MASIHILLLTIWMIDLTWMPAINRQRRPKSIEFHIGWSTIVIIVKNLSQPLEFWANSDCFLRLSPQDGVRTNFESPALPNVLQNVQFTWKLCANQLNSFWVSKDNVAIWQKYKFCHPIGWISAVLKPFQNEICQNCRETIPLVQDCFWFELSFTVLKLSSKIWVNPWNFEQMLAVFCVFLREMASKEF